MRVREGVNLMRLISVFLAFLTTTVCAEPNWVSVSRDASSDDGMVQFVDVNSIKKLGKQQRRAWTLSNYQIPRSIENGAQFKSVTTLELVDCDKVSLNSLTMIFYAESMGQGAVLASYRLPEGRWEYFPPGSIAEDSISFICGRK
jgi:hypothetical protein